MAHTYTTASQTRPNAWGNIAVWTLQVLVAALFLFAGSMKFIMPVEAMTQQMHFSGLFLHFIGACEVLGGLGLILPGALRIKPGLTALAAALLIPIMVGATVVSVKSGGVADGLVPFIVGIACAFIAVRRSPRRAALQTSSLQPAS